MAANGMALREVSERLKAYGIGSAVDRSGLLLRLLSEGKLTARFNFPSVERPEIKVPAAYWNEVKAGEFRKALDGNSANKGDYVVTPGRFAKEYLEWYARKHELSKPSAEAELTAALQASNVGVEVYVLEQDWEIFINGGGIEVRRHSYTAPKSNRGIRENENWSAILVEVAVELLNAPISPSPKKGVIARQALSRIKPRANTEFPKLETVEDKIAEIINRTGKS